MVRIHRFIFAELSCYFLLSLCLFTFLLFLNRLLQLTELIVNKGVPLLLVGKLLAIIAPSFFIVTIPVALLVAAVMTFSRLSTDGELVAMAAHGVSFLRLLVGVAVLSTLAYLASVLLIFQALPWSLRAFEELKYQVVQARPSAFEVKERVFNDAFDGVVLYVREVRPGGREFRGVLISDTRPKEADQLIVAKRGELLAQPHAFRVVLRLADGALHRFLPAKREYHLVRFSTYDLLLEPHGALEGQRPLGRSLKQLSLDALKEKLKELTPDHPKYRRYLMEYHRKFATPFACLILGFLGAALGVQNRRSGRGGGMVLSLAALFLYYVVRTLGEGLGEQGALPVALGVWLPNLTFGPLAAWALRRVHRGATLGLGALPLGRLLVGREGT
ncbi:MAG: LPS export ABC transporter permease LptF [Nitrospinota bacterium]